MTGYDVLYVRHAAVTDFDSIPVKYLMQRISSWKVFIEELEEISSDVGFD